MFFVVSEGGEIIDLNNWRMVLFLAVSLLAWLALALLKEKQDYGVLSPDTYVRGMFWGFSAALVTLLLAMVLEWLALTNPLVLLLGAATLMGSIVIYGVIK